MSLYERTFPRFRPKRELRAEGSSTGWGAGTPDYEEPTCVPPNDARRAVPAAG
jgi:hypothetical protein